MQDLVPGHQETWFQPLVGWFGQLVIIDECLLWIDDMNIKNHDAVIGQGAC